MTKASLTHEVSGDRTKVVISHGGGVLELPLDLDHDPVEMNDPKQAGHDSWRHWRYSVPRVGARALYEGFTEAIQLGTGPWVSKDCRILRSWLFLRPNGQVLSVELRKFYDDRGVSVGRATWAFRDESLEAFVKRVSEFQPTQPLIISRRHEIHQFLVDCLARKEGEAA